MLCSLISNYSWVMACLFGDKEWLRMLHKTFESLSGFGRNSWVHTDTARSPAESIWFDTVGDFLHEWKSVCVCLTSLRHGVYGNWLAPIVLVHDARCPASRTADTSPEVEQVMVIGALVRDLKLTPPACDQRPLISWAGCHSIIPKWLVQASFDSNTNGWKC